MDRQTVHTDIADEMAEDIDPIFGGGSNSVELRPDALSRVNCEEITISAVVPVFDGVNEVHALEHSICLRDTSGDVQEYKVLTREWFGSSEPNFVTNNMRMRCTRQTSANGVAFQAVSGTPYGAVPDNIITAIKSSWPEAQQKVLQEVVPERAFWEGRLTTLKL